MTNFLSIIFLSIVIIVIIHYILNLNRTFLVIFLSSLVFLFVSFILIYNGLEFFGLIFVIIYIGAIVVMFLFLIITVDMSEETLKQQKRIVLDFNFILDIFIIFLISFVLYIFFYYIIIEDIIIISPDFNFCLENFHFQNKEIFSKANLHSITNTLYYFESKFQFNDIYGYLGTYAFSQNKLSLILVAVLLLVALLVSINICISK
jgi:NADH:ubiquinone oxidoreductase subunit 6 (subunit J)